MIAMRFFTLIGFGLLLTTVNDALAQSDNRFQIDIVIFANNDPNAIYAENWPDNLRLRYPGNWTRLPGQGESNGALLRVETQEEEFAAALNSLRLSSRYRILFQASWQQELYSRRRAPAILVQGGDKRGDHYELEGYLKVAVERYLYLDTDLWLSRFGQGSDNYYLPRPPYDPRAEEELMLEDMPESYQQDRQEFLAQNPDFQDRSQTFDTNAVPIARIVVMDEERRLRSGELHYLDHPLFGLMVKISKAQDLPVATGPDQISP